MITAKFFKLLELLMQALHSAWYLLAFVKTKYGLQLKAHLTQLKAHLGERMAQEVTMI